jgi:GT2 family glycosyltransferase
VLPLGPVPGGRLLKATSAALAVRQPGSRQRPSARPDAPPGQQSLPYLDGAERQTCHKGRLIFRVDWATPVVGRLQAGALSRENARRRPHEASLSLHQTPSSPTPVVPSANAWRSLKVPALGSWMPRERVTVVIPHYSAEFALSLTLTALGQQTYPASLLEVVVVDDGSPTAPRVPRRIGDVPVRLLVQENRGFRAGAARNLGAENAAGDVLVFLDCDMVPDPTMVEAHARWHQEIGYALTLGFRTHVSFESITADDVAGAAATTGLAVLLSGRPQERPEYIESHMERTRELTSDDDDLFRVVASGNLGVRRQFFDRIGRFDESFNQWGGEDTELGYRAFVEGALLIPDREAHCWHQGLPGFKDDAKQASLQEQRATLTQRIAHRGFRRSTPGRSFAVPRVGVEVGVARDQPTDDVLRIVSDVLASTFHDLAVCLRLPIDHPRFEIVRRQFLGDPRVLLGSEDLLESLPGTPILLQLPPFATVDPSAITTAVNRLEAEQLGTLHITVKGVPAPPRLAIMRTRRAWQRARLVAADGEDLDEVTGRLFREAWAAGSAIGIHTTAVERSQSTSDLRRATPAPSGDLASVQQFVSQLSARDRHLLMMLAKRALVAHRGLTVLREDRDGRAAWIALMSFGRATLPDGLVARLRPRLRRAVWAAGQKRKQRP